MVGFADVELFNVELLFIVYYRIFTYRDLKNSLDWAKEKGFAEGYVEIRLKILMLEYGKTREEALVKIAKELLEKNVSTQAIYMTTGISVEDI